MKRVFKTRAFANQTKKFGLPDSSLCAAVAEIESGLIDADLGGGLVKKRVALPGRGKSAGARTLIATNQGSRWFFVFGFAKNERANISTVELEALKRYSGELLKLTGAELNRLTDCAELMEICNDQKDARP
ncbi:MAG: hypothetical protein C0434_09730 [Xanthomonadaceae bacterium]|nr:hypothetical protein [Xanthomonadaceae bacterium]